MAVPSGSSGFFAIIQRMLSSAICLAISVTNVTLNETIVSFDSKLKFFTFSRNVIELLVSFLSYGSRDLKK